MAYASKSGDVPSVTARKRDMKDQHAKRTLTEVSIRKEDKGFTVSESFNSPEPSMGYEPPKRYAFSTEAEATKYVQACMKRLGEKAT